MLEYQVVLKLPLNILLRAFDALPSRARHIAHASSTVHFITAAFHAKISGSEGAGASLR